MGVAGQRSLPRWDRLSRLPELGHLPSSGARAPKPSFLQGRGGHLRPRRVQRVRGPDDTGSGSRTDARPPPGPVLPLHVFFSPFSPQVFFISKRAARCCSLPRVSPARAQTPQGARGCVCVCIQAGGRGRGALTPRLCSECRLGSQRPACRALVLALTRLKSLNSRNEKVLPVTLTLLGGARGGFCRFVLCWGWGNPRRKN